MGLARGSAKQLALEREYAFAHDFVARVHAAYHFCLGAVRGADFQLGDAHRVLTALHEHRGFAVDEGDRARGQQRALLLAAAGGVDARVHRLAGAQLAIAIVDLDADRRAAGLQVDDRADARHAAFEDFTLRRERAQLDAITHVDLGQIALEHVQLDPQMVEVGDAKGHQLPFDRLPRRDVALDDRALERRAQFVRTELARATADATREGRDFLAGRAQQQLIALGFDARDFGFALRGQVLLRKRLFALQVDVGRALLRLEHADRGLRFTELRALDHREDRAGFDRVALEFRDPADEAFEPRAHRGHVLGVESDRTHGVDHGHEQGARDRRKLELRALGEAARERDAFTLDARRIRRFRWRGRLLPGRAAHLPNGGSDAEHPDADANREPTLLCARGRAVASGDRRRRHGRRCGIRYCTHGNSPVISTKSPSNCQLLSRISRRRSDKAEKSRRLTKTDNKSPLPARYVSLAAASARSAAGNA